MGLTAESNSASEDREMKIQEAQKAIQKASYDVELLGLAPYQWAGEEPDSFVAFWRAEQKQPGGQYTICVVKREKIEHKGNYEERSDAQEAFCRLVFPYQR